MTRIAEARPPTAIDGEIEREILRTRRRIGRTLDALSQRLAERLLARRRWVGAREPAEPDVVDAHFRPDPLALGLIGAGVAWLVAENARLFRRPKREAAAGLDQKATRRERQLIARAKEDLWLAAEAFGHRTAARVRGERATAAAADRSATK